MTTKRPCETPKGCSAPAELAHKQTGIVDFTDFSPATLRDFCEVVDQGVLRADERTRPCPLRNICAVLNDFDGGTK